ncbi:MAG: GspE/PulE family protein [Alphaproteobacteria bacterium]|nr:GspE/PulE family protein [Alphaproteobacteria bacterium]
MPVAPVTITKLTRVPTKLALIIPFEYAKRFNIAPIKQEGTEILIASSDIKNLDMRDALNFISAHHGLTYTLQQVTKEELVSIISSYGAKQESIAHSIEELESSTDVILGVDKDEKAKTGVDIEKEEAPIIKFVQNILAQAVERGASDIHIEPHPENSVVRLRVDSVLEETLIVPKKVHNPLIARIKILADMRLDERRKPQDGRFSSYVKGGKIDFRVATFPTYDGEKVTLRVLDKQKGLLSLKDLGLSPENYQLIRTALRRPFGLILATGPTGAGKTTTLYSLLNEIDKKSQNVVSLEDPVEYSLEGVNQSNIFPEIGYTFANGLRSILRGDPNIILVGEIRDKETALLAVQAALTGHTVLSTIHTNTAIGAVARLINFGIDPFLLAPTLSLVVGQRMMRRLANAGRDIPLTPTMQKSIEKQFEHVPEAYRSAIPPMKSFKEALPGAESSTGLKGRLGAFEVLDITDEIRDAILANASESKIEELAVKNGMYTLGQDAIIKGLQGFVPYTEVVKLNADAGIALDETPESVAQ